MHAQHTAVNCSELSQISKLALLLQTSCKTRKRSGAVKICAVHTVQHAMMQSKATFPEQSEHGDIVVVHL